MERIPAAGNLTVEVDIDRWRLLSNSNSEERVLVEAKQGQAMRYMDVFANKRRLPISGQLPLPDIQRVVLGWSQDDQSWHLGLLLEKDLAEIRGSRWCEMAKWHDPDTTMFSDVATLAGRTLARTLTRPFNLLEPNEPAAAAQTVQPPPLLRSLPLEFDGWTLEKKAALQFRRGGQWARSKVIRLLWYTVLAVVYFVLSILSLQKIIALPQPEFLPYLGIVVGVFLIGVVLYTVYELLNKPNIVRVDATGVRALRGKSNRWFVETGKIESVYISEVVNRSGKKRVVHHGEINLLLRNEKFRNVLEQPHAIEDDHIPTIEDITEAVAPLTLYNVSSDLQTASLYVAQALNVEARYDRRLK